MSYNRRHYIRMIRILNTALICLIILSILCLSMDMASASSSNGHGNSGGKSNANNDRQLEDQSHANISPDPTDTATPATPASSHKPTTTAMYAPQAEPVKTIAMSDIYGTAIQAITGTSNNTSQIMAANETTNYTIMNSTNPYNTMDGNGSSVISEKTARQQGWPSGNWLVLAIIAMPSILASIIVVVQYVRKIG